jgi:outer membrane biosynthesis protein TonB
MARGGISPYPGPGGAGSGMGGKPPVPGVAVSGGSSNIITLPSFGSGGNQPSFPGRSSAGNKREGPDITIVASSRSGGAFNFYGALKGDKVYSIYIPTTLGIAVMQFSDPTSAEHPYAEDLAAPQPMRADLPANLKRSRLVIACILDRSGLIRNPRVLESEAREMTSSVLAALANWKFRPAFRGDEPVEVNAILGFGIDTR